MSEFIRTTKNSQGTSNSPANCHNHLHAAARLVPGTRFVMYLIFVMVICSPTSSQAAESSVSFVFISARSSHISKAHSIAVRAQQ